MKAINTKVLKKINIIDVDGLIKTILWILLCAGFLVVLSFMLKEYFYVPANTIVTIDGNSRTINDWINWIAANPTDPSVNNVYAGLLSVKFPIIDFSLMSFFGRITSSATGMYADVWKQRKSDLSLAYSYVFITSIIAIVALAMLLFSSLIMYRHKRINDKIGLNGLVPDSLLGYKIFNINMFSNFTTSLAIACAFFNFLTTLVVISYWIFLYLLKFIMKKIPSASNFSKHLNTFSNSKTELIQLIVIMFYQNIYTIIKSTFIKYYSVNLDTVFSIILPIGTATVVVGLFIKNMLSSSVNALLKEIKGIDDEIGNFNLFYYEQGANALNDYSFVKILPPIIKSKMSSKKFNVKEANDLLIKITQAIDFINTNSQNITVNDRKYYLWILFHKVETSEQIDSIKSNVGKINTYLSK